MAKDQETDLLHEEMHAGDSQDTSAPAAPTAEEAAAEAKDDRVWHNVAGAEVSKSEFIREQFTLNNLSRKQIADQFAIHYRTVYGATVNMINEAEPAGRGRTASASKINVTADGKVVTSIEGVAHVDNVAVADEEAAALVTSEVDRNTWIKGQVEGGRERGEIAKALGLSYGVVYGMTKEIEGTKQRHELVDPENGETVSRSEMIRRMAARGKTKSEIATELQVDYPVVWSALKGTKSEDEKYGEAVDKLSKFAEHVEDVAAFNALIEQLHNVKLKAAPVDAAPAAPAAAAGTDSVYADGK